jgi:hypothetical protein
MRHAMLAALIALTFVVPVLAKDPVSPLDHKQLLSYDDGGKLQPVRTPADWARRRQQILAGFEQAIGPLPDRTKLPPLDIKIVEEVQEGDVLRQSISFHSRNGERVTAYLWIPKRNGTERRAGILALHPTGAIGKGIVAGYGKANRQYGTELAQRGYVVLAPDYVSFGGMTDHDFAKDDYVSGTMKGIFDHMRCVDLLVARDDVDGEHIAAIGHSLGGHNSIFVGVYDQRIKAVVSSCGWCPFHDYYAGKIAGWTSDRYMPALRDKYELNPDRVPFDFYELVGALAPRGFLSVSPLRDSNFDYKGVQKAIPEAAKVYELLGAKDQLQVRYPDCEHDFPDDMRREAYRFLDQQLKHKPAREVP